MVKLSRKLIGGSLVLLVAFNLFNILNFFFQFSMARLLSVAEYGILATLFSLIYILAIPAEAIQTIITRYTAKEKNKGKIKNILKKSLRKSFKLSIYVFLGYLLLSLLLSNLLKINYGLLALTGLMIIVGFLVPVTRGVLQGEKKFGSLGKNMVAEGITKVVLGMALVFLLTYLGFLQWRIYGAMIGVIGGGFLALMLSFGSLKDVLGKKEKKAQTPGIYGYAKPTFIITLILLLFFSIDIILAKIFFNAHVAGSYAIASVLAKIIFIGTHPISKAMFPLSSEKSKNKIESEKIFMNSVGIVLALIVLALIVISIFSNPIVTLFSGKSVPEASGTLLYVAIAISLLSLTNLVLLYKLSIGKTKGYLYLLAFIPIEIALLSYFSSNLFQFSVALIVASAMFLWGSIVLLRE